MHRIFILLILSLVANVAAAQDGGTFLVSVNSSGQQANAYAGNYGANISDDGRYVAFSSEATNLVPGDLNGYRDVFVHDRLLLTTTCVSVSSSGLQGNEESVSPSISGDGRFVAFASRATNLTPGDMDDTFDIYLHDRQTGVTSFASAKSWSFPHITSHCVSPWMSRDGHNLVYYALDPYWRSSRVFVFEPATNRYAEVSLASTGLSGYGLCYHPSLSDEGRYVAFYSDGETMVPGDTNNTGDVFVRDRVAGWTRRVSVSSSGQQGNGRSGYAGAVVSGEGRYVAFESSATNLVENDLNNDSDVFVHDLSTGETTLVSVSSTGRQGNEWSGRPQLTEDGRYVVFTSDATNLVRGDYNGRTDVFRHDRQTGETIRLSLGEFNRQANNQSWSLTGRAHEGFIVFLSAATNLVRGDWNSAGDVFIREMPGR